MQRSLGFQQQYYADDGLWIDTRAQQHSYAVHEETWNSNNHSHKQFPGMHVKPGAFVVEFEFPMSKQHGKLGVSHGMFQENWQGGHVNFQEGNWHHPYCNYVHGGGKRFPYGATYNTFVYPNSGVKFNLGGHHHGYVSVEVKYEALSERCQHHGPTVVKMDERRNERHNGGNEDFYHTNPYERNMVLNCSCGRGCGCSHGNYGYYDAD